MNHPKNAKGGWELDAIVFDGGGAEIVVALLKKEPGGWCPADTIRMALRWNPSFVYNDKSGKQVTAVSWMGEETEWFLLPFDFSVAIAKTLIERKVTNGMDENFNEVGFDKLVKWLIENEGLSDGICY
jgi:hypothetical protein